MCTMSTVKICYGQFVYYLFKGSIEHFIENKIDNSTCDNSRVKAEGEESLPVKDIALRES